VFKIADDNGMLLIDLKDLRAMLRHVGEHAKVYTTNYGNISAASIGAIQRGLIEIEQQGGDSFFGEPALNIADLIQTDRNGHGMINILAAEQLMNAPKLYATFLLWLLSELFEQLPEVGDLEQPKLVFFFDEAHLLFADASSVLLEKVERLVRLIRSKGVGVYFVTQNPMDIPDTVLGQLSNRIQHALRAFTPRDQKAVHSAATTLRPNPTIDVASAITELGVGEALVSVLDAQGRPGIVERAFVIPPGSRLGPITAAERQSILQASILADVYETAVDRESAYEKLNQDAATSQATANNTPPQQSTITGSKAASSATRGRASDGILEVAAKSAMRAIGSQIGREIIRGVLGSILGGRRR
jgi:DNA helicase HerA-like ATPase